MSLTFLWCVAASLTDTHNVIKHITYTGSSNVSIFTSPAIRLFFSCNLVQVAPYRRHSLCINKINFEKDFLNPKLNFFNSFLLKIYENRNLRQRKIADELHRMELSFDTVETLLCDISGTNSCLEAQGPK